MVFDRTVKAQAGAELHHALAIFHDKVKFVHKHTCLSSLDRLARAMQQSAKIMLHADLAGCRWPACQGLPVQAFS